MKRILLSLLFIAPISFAGPFDILIRQQNIAGTAIFERVVPLPNISVPGQGYNSVLGIDQYTNLPMMYAFGPTLGVTNGVMDANLNWDFISGKPALATVATSGDYNDLINKPSGTVRSQSAATRTLNTVFQVSSTRDAFVQYAVQCTVTASIGEGQDGDVFLDIASDSGFTENVQSVDVAPCSQTYTLAIALQGVQKGPANVRGYIPAGYYARIRTVNNTGSPAFAYRLGQEVLQ